MAPVATDDLLDVLVEFVEACSAVVGELEALEDIEVPVPESLLKELSERDAMARTMKWLLGAGGPGEQLREAVIARYRQELQCSGRWDDGGRVPVDQEVVAELRETLEWLRLRRVSWPALDHALPPSWPAMF